LPEVSEKLDKAKNEPNNFDAQMEAGNLYVKIRAADKAQEFYNRAEQLNPTIMKKSCSSEMDFLIPENLKSRKVV
jgi:tetratricopeptide (TPR) repeat protein